MKKIISLLCIAIILVTSCVPVSAYTWTYNSSRGVIRDNDDNVADVRNTIYYYLTDNTDLNKAAICGILGNIWAECCFLLENIYGSYNGICQWSGWRWEACKEHCASIGYSERSLEGQMSYLVYELKNSYTSVYKALLNVDNTESGVYEAENVFRVHFECCGTQAMYRRQAAAITYWNNLDPVNPGDEVVYTTEPPTYKTAEPKKYNSNETKENGTIETTTTTTTATTTAKINKEEEKVKAVFAAIAEVFEQVTMPTESVLI